MEPSRIWISIKHAPARAFVVRGERAGRGYGLSVESNNDKIEDPLKLSVSQLLNLTIHKGFCQWLVLS